MLTHARRLVTVAATAMSCLLVFANPASAACYSDNSDGSAERTLDFDHFDDTASTTLESGPIVDLSGTAQATLTMSGQAYGCTGSAGLQLIVNGAAAATFDACNIWPTSYSWNGSINFPAALLHPGPNTLSLVDISGTWNDGVYLGVDSNTFTGRTTMAQNGSTVTGELVWSLYSPALLCV